MYRVDCALEVLGGAVGREDEEEGRGEGVHVGGVAPSPSARHLRGRREERRGGDLLVAVAIHSCRSYSAPWLWVCGPRRFSFFFSHAAQATARGPTMSEKNGGAV